MKFLTSLLIFFSIFLAGPADAKKLYHSDGVTVLGHYIRCVVEPCDVFGNGIGYSNITTGAISVVSGAANFNNITFYYSSTGCFGSAYTTTGNISATDGVQFVTIGGTGYSNWGVQSSRTNGVCTDGYQNLTFAYITSFVGTPLCGAGACKIKP